MLEGTFDIVNTLSTQYFSKVTRPGNQITYIKTI